LLQITIGLLLRCAAFVSFVRSVCRLHLAQLFLVTLVELLEPLFPQLQPFFRFESWVLPHGQAFRREEHLERHPVRGRNLHRFDSLAELGRVHLPDGLVAVLLHLVDRVEAELTLLRAVHLFRIQVYAGLVWVPQLGLIVRLDGRFGANGSNAKPGLSERQVFILTSPA